MNKRLAAIEPGILRNVAEHRPGVHPAVGTERGVLHDRHVGTDNAAVAEPCARFDMGERPDAHVLADFGAVLDHRGLMDHPPTPNGLAHRLSRAYCSLTCVFTW